MYYVEQLRVTKVLKILLLIVAALVALAVISRLMQGGRHGIMGPDPAPGTVPVVTRDSSGATTKTYTDVHGAHIVLRSLPDGTFTYTSTKEIPGRGPVVFSSQGDERIPLAVLLLIASFAAALAASIFGLTLSRENDGHLELAWTKPASRDAYALSLIATDLVGIVLAGLIALACILLCLTIEGAGATIFAGPGLLLTALFCILFPVSVYALTLAATASLRRGAAFFAIFWPVALILPTLTAVTWMNLGTIVRMLDVIDPIAYFYAFASFSPGAGAAMFPLGPGVALQLGMISGLCAICLVASLAQWRRLEA